MHIEILTENIDIYSWTLIKNKNISSMLSCMNPCNSIYAPYIRPCINSMRILID